MSKPYYFEDMAPGQVQRAGGARMEADVPPPAACLSGA